jgi:hypothetical protein
MLSKSVDARPRWRGSVCKIVFTPQPTLSESLRGGWNQRIARPVTVRVPVGINMTKLFLLIETWLRCPNQTMARRCSGGDAVILGVACLTLLLQAACRTSPVTPQVDLSEPGWRISRGQAVWRASRKSPEIAGELLMATNANGHTLIEFTKTPLPLLIARTTPESWRVELVAENRTYAGRGRAPTRVLWLHLAACVGGGAPPLGLSFIRSNDSHWRLENTNSGEVIEGYLLPAASASRAGRE